MMLLVSVYFHLFLFTLHRWVLSSMSMTKGCNMQHLVQGRWRDWGGWKREKVLSGTKEAGKCVRICSGKDVIIGFVIENSILDPIACVWCWDEMKGMVLLADDEKSDVFPSPPGPFFLQESRFFVLFAMGAYLQKQLVLLGSMHPTNLPHKYLASTEKISLPRSA